MDKTSYRIQHWRYSSQRPHPRARSTPNGWRAEFSPREVIDLARVYDVMIRYQTKEPEIFLDEPGGLFRIRG